jgi:hypothetical protein
MNNKEFDNKLKTLKDYDPQVSPDWDAFIAGNKARIEDAGKIADQTSGNSAKYFTGIKYAAVLLTVFAGIFFFWYFAGSDNKSPLDSLPPSREMFNAPARPASLIEQELLNGNEVPAVIEIQPLNANDQIPAETDARSKSDDVEEGESTAKSKVVPSDGEPRNSVIISKTDTVIIQKTITVKDTVKVKKQLPKK